MGEVEISVIVPTRNALPFLERCLRSIEQQTFRSFEVIVVNDGSDDGSAAWLDERLAQKPAYRVVHHELPQGLSAARNHGIALARGRFLAFLDADDWFEPTMLETLHRAVLSTQSQVAHIVRKICTNEGPFVQPREEVVRVLDGVGAAVEMLEQEEYAVWSRLYDAELVRSLGPEPFPVGLTCEDRVFNMRVLPLASRAAESNRVEYHYFMNMGSISLGGLSQRAMQILEADELMVGYARASGDERLVKLALDRQAKGAFSMLVKYARFGITDDALSGQSGHDALRMLRQRFVSDYPRLAASPLPASKRLVAWQLRYMPALVRAEFAIYNVVTGKGRG